MEGRGCVFQQGMAFGYPPETQPRVQFRVSTKSGEVHTDTGGATTISTVSGSLQMIANVSPANATDPTVVWSVVDGNGHATISATGILSAVDNGTVTVKATAHDGSGISGTEVITISQPVGTLVIDWNNQSGQTVSSTHQLYYQISTDQFFMDDTKIVRGDHNTGTGSTSTGDSVTATLYPGTYYVRGWYDSVGNTPALSGTDVVGYLHSNPAAHGFVVVAKPIIVTDGSFAEIRLDIEPWGSPNNVWPAYPVYLKVSLSYSGGNAVSASHQVFFIFTTDPTFSGDFRGVFGMDTASPVTLLCILESATSYYLLAVQDASATIGPGGIFELNDPVLIYNNKGYSLTNGITGGGPDAFRMTSNTNLDFTVTDSIKVTP